MHISASYVFYLVKYVNHKNIYLFYINIVQLGE